MAGNSDDDIETQSHGKRARSEDCTDRISNLPKDLIHNIMQRLPISLAARMSVLSKSWRGNWESMPHLEFDNDFADTFINNNDEVVDTHEWSSIISNILFHHEGPIKAFHLTVPDTDDTTDLVISSWILYVSRNGVTSFKLINGSMESLVELPSRLFSCMLLEDLSLVGCAISHLPHITGFRKLLHLELVNVQFKGEMLREFVASSPLLETLILLGCSNDDHLTINLPALKNLELSGFFRSITFNNTSSLLSVSLFLLLEAPYTFEGAADMIQFLASSCKLQRLSISHFQILADGGISSILPTTFRNLKILNLSSIDISSIHYFMCAIGMIRSCPNMNLRSSSESIHSILCRKSWKME